MGTKNIEKCCTCCCSDVDLDEIFGNSDDQPRQINIKYFIKGCCCCGDGCGGGEKPDPDPDPDDPNHPGSPLPGEPTHLYVTPDVSVPNNEPLIRQRVLRWEVPDDYAPDGWHGPHVLTADPDTAMTKTSRTKEGVTSSTWIYKMNRMQYVTGYELGTDAANYKYMPKNWKFYLSNDFGENWTLIDERQYIWEGRDRQDWDVKPGFYNAYKLEVQDVCGGNYIALRTFRLVGLPTEVIPGRIDHAFYNEQDVSFFVGGAGACYGARSKTEIAAGGFVEHNFRTRRKVRSCTVCFNDSLPNGFDLLGSDDGNTWEIVLSVRNANFVMLEDAYFDLDKVAFYSRYRLKPTSKTTLSYYQLYRTGAPTDPALPVIPEEEYDQYDPNDPGHPELPGLPFKGEGRYLIATPAAEPLPAADSRKLAKENYINVYTLDASDAYPATADQGAAWKTGTGVVTNTITALFKRYQYITGYEVKNFNSLTDIPKNWELYLTQDGGDTWTLAHTGTYTWGWTLETTGADLPPDFYNGYKFKVTQVNGGNCIQVQTVRMLGVPTEILPCSLQTTVSGIARCENCFFTGKNFSGAASAATYLTNFDFSKVTTILPEGYVDFSFIDKRKARSFSIMLTDSSLTGWDILGSNDGTTWDTLFSTRGQTLGAKEQYDYRFDKTAFYRRYRLAVKQCKTAAGANIAHFQIYR